MLSPLTLKPPQGTVKPSNGDLGHNRTHAVTTGHRGHSLDAALKEVGRQERGELQFQPCFQALAARHALGIPMVQQSETPQPRAEPIVISDIGVGSPKAGGEHKRQAQDSAERF